MDKTELFDIAKFKSESITTTLKEVAAILNERGYNPINQIVGYLTSGDPGYITSYKGARKLMESIDNSELLALLLKNTLEKWAS